ncbi:MAG: M23 family metallopeptidase [Verrucomicrobiota bacterium]
MAVPPQYQSSLPHPATIVPKVVLLVCALFAFFHLVYRLANPEEPPHPFRVGLLHAEKPQDLDELLRSGMILPSPLELARTPRIEHLTYPLGSEDGAFSYNARPFGEVNHLGADLNGIGGENSDRGDPVFAVGPGIVTFAGPASEGWGNLVILQHRDPEGRFFQSFYAHLEHIWVALGDSIPRGETVGTVGTASGRYLAHLHFEIRDAVSVGSGYGYHPLSLDRRPPEAFLERHRLIQKGDPNRRVPPLHQISDPPVRDETNPLRIPPNR